MIQRHVVILRRTPSLGLGALTVAVNLLQSTLAPAEAFPFTPVTFNNPVLRVEKKQDWTQNRPQYYQDSIQQNQYNWPNPLQKGVGKDWIFATQIDIQPSPFVPVTFNNPLIKTKINSDWIQSRPQFYQDSIQQNQYNWPNPLIKKAGKDWIFSRKLEAQETPFVPVIFNNSLVKARIREDWIQRRPQNYTDSQPFNQFNWPNPSPKWKLIVTIDSGPQEDSTFPVNVLEWRNPLFNNNPFTKNKFWSNNNLQDTLTPVVAPPFTPIIFNNPRKNREIDKTWIFIPTNEVVVVFPVGERIYFNPQVKKRIRQDWYLAKPQYYVEPTQPISQRDWPNPRHKARLLVNTFIINKPAVPPPIHKSFYSVIDLGMPPLKRTYHHDWKFYYIVDQNLPNQQPFRRQETALPLRKRANHVGYIQIPRIQVLTSPAPFKQLIYPNPIRIKRPTLTEINNLLQYPFDIQPGDVPFYENKWPNPLVKGRNFPQGWQVNKPTYYVEEPLQPNQYDWPVFRSVKQNQVGFIDRAFRIIEEPFFKSITDVPLRKKVLALTFTDNPIKVIITPTGEIPFAQYDWPIFLKTKRFVDLITFLLPRFGEIPPEIIGRVICLLSSLDEYEIESALDEFDLESRFEEYDIESGGDSCE